METEAKKKLIIMLDASALKESGCSLRLFNNIVIGYNQPVQYNDVEFGVAFHRFKYEYKKYNYSIIGQAIGKKAAFDYFNKTKMKIKSGKSYLDIDFLMQVCDGYIGTYTERNENYKVVLGKNKEDKEEPLLELPFCFPYYVDDYMEILLAGTMDEIGKFDNGIYSVEDIKTTSMWKEDEYLESYKLSPQLYFYRWAIKQYAIAYPESIWATIDKGEVGCHISAIFMKGKDKPVTYRRGDVMLFRDAELKEFEALLIRKIASLVNHVRIYLDTGAVPLREGMLNGCCATVYGPCKYAMACGAVDLPTRNIMLEQLFIKKHYNPLTFHD